MRKFHLNNTVQVSKKGNDALKDKVQATLDEMFEDGTVEKIAQDYDEFGVPGSLIQK